MKGEIAVKPNATVQCINMQHLDSLSQVHLCGDPLTGQSINPPSLHTNAQTPSGSRLGGILSGVLNKVRFTNQYYCTVWTD